MSQKLKDKFSSISEFDTFLCCDENKTRVQHPIKNELFCVVSSISVELLYSLGTFVWNVSKNEEILDFKCNQFGADKVIFSICYYIHSADKDTMAVIDATDADCYFQLAEISKKIQDQLALKRKGKLISYYQFFPPYLA